jgi:alpha-tubulin suppressor-like RCC1 family protein
LRHAFIAVIVGALIGCTPSLARASVTSNPFAQRSAAAPRRAVAAGLPADAVVRGRYIPIVGDFDCNGRDDIFWYAPGSAQDFVWYSTRNGFVSHDYAVNSVYTPVAGDFDGDGCSDIFWYAPGRASDYVWYGSQFKQFTAEQEPVFGSYTPIVGDFDGDGHSDIWWFDSHQSTNEIWYGAGPGAFTPVSFDVRGIVWAIGGPGHAVQPIEGDIDGNGFDDAILYVPGSFLAPYVYGTNQRGVFSVHRDLTPGDDLVGRAVRFSGGNGRGVLWYGPGSAPDYFWSGNSGGSIRMRTDVRGTYDPLVGDFSGLGHDQIFWYAPGVSPPIWTDTAHMPPAPPPYPTAIAAGAEHGCAIVSGAVKCWGDNRFGELGDGSNRSSALPVSVRGLPAGATSVVAGFDDTCAIVRDAAWCWGLNNHGQLGDGSTANRDGPIPVAGLGAGVSAIAMSDYYRGTEHTCAVVSGAAKCWGYNGEGELGNGTTTSSAVPVPVAGLTANVTSVAAGGRASCAVVHGAARCWGGNDAGQLGNGNMTASLVPVTVLHLGGGVHSVGAGPGFACALSQAGAVFCWGYDADGELGDTHSALPRTTPVMAQGMTSVSALSVGDEVSCAIREAEPNCWGSDAGWPPAEIIGVAGPATAVTQGVATCAIVKGSATCWGLDQHGELGNGAALPSDEVPFESVLVLHLT